jgi:anti-sigma B factor antagonist
MEINKSESNGIVEINISGRLDAATSSDAESVITGVIDDNHSKILINLENLTYISSAGLRVLLVAAKEMKAKNGKIILCSLIDNVKSVFEISGFSIIFEICDAKEEALGKF